MPIDAYYVICVQLFLRYGQTLERERELAYSYPTASLILIYHKSGFLHLVIFLLHHNNGMRHARLEKNLEQILFGSN